MNKKILSAFLAFSLLMPTAYADFEWADEAVTYCVEEGILTGKGGGNLALADGLTREEMATLLCHSFDFEIKEDVAFEDISTDSELPSEEEKETEPLFSDLPEDRWSYKYVLAVSDCLFGGTKLPKQLNPEELVSREEFTATLVLAYGLKNSSLRNSKLLDFNFKDAKDIDKDYKKLVGIAVERGLMSGYEGYLRPNDNLNRAEACSLLYRAIMVKSGELTVDPKELGVIQSRTPMLAEPEITLDEIKAWATSKGATESFVSAADIYYYYGEITGIRPDILYAQAAKETGFGKYGGAVLPEMNNFAGIKKYGLNGDATEDHESFETQDDGVRAHFNHMSAYVGTDPVGEPHGRYKSVAKMPWAGSVVYMEELGGKWCPDLYYGFSILHDYIESMKG